MAFRRRNKSYPFFSQEFLIQNHADVVFTLVIFILIGLMFEATAKTAILFIQPQYNVTTQSPEGELTLYHYGWKDCATILFYFFIAIILHAVVQEYLLDKINRRLHLSKSKNTKFNESGQLCVFHLVSSVWSFYVLITEGYLLHPSSLWENYPHVHLRFQVKFFYLTQIAYWLHALPELYFQKVRKVSDPGSGGVLASSQTSAFFVLTSGVCVSAGGDLPAAAVHLPLPAARRCGLFVKLESGGSGAALPPVRVGTGLPHRPALLLHRRESPENVRRLGRQLRLHQDVHADADVPRRRLRSGSLREPRLRPGDGELQHGSDKDDRAPAGVSDPVLATLEVHPFPAETLERIPARASCSQEELEANAAAGQEGLGGLPRKRHPQSRERNLPPHQKTEIPISRTQ
ncbi:translocating chain-associated membrane protein 2 isoform X1 [Synchiropus splendidus]|uniref:translocating chain-associated membrane protein 2 isoform X1 n=1 Tax=Synchiropus splendidus TaxID=270530 RepID=UPI00237EE2B7|nr:translocating chain-associated membrane protein 2 isoform X1 [Synchiropus splendidus]